MQAFRGREAEFLRPGYNETQARTEWINPLLEALGWDVRNTGNLPLAVRDVIQEASVEVEEEPASKKPDYELLLAGQRKLFLEAKKPEVRLEHNQDAAFQTRRYGYSAGLPISVVTNFREMAVYDCRVVPSREDEAHVARLCYVKYEEYEQRFDDLWTALSKAAMHSGEFDRRYGGEDASHEALPFDGYFLRQIRKWRRMLAEDVHARVPNLTESQLQYVVQLLLSRIVFLRICEDREIEEYELLKGLAPEARFEAFREILQRADGFYNSGLFRLLDDERLGISVGDEVLGEITEELYYPYSPYTFSVVQAQILGGIYEQFLDEAVAIRGGAIQIEQQPEARESGGVVPTPPFVAEAIVAKTLDPLVSGKSPTELSGLSVADICCGAGTFLVAAYEYLLDHCLAWYVRHPEAHDGDRVFCDPGGEWKLTFKEKRRILEAHIRGVDIDHNAVEMARFSLLLKLVEGESRATLQAFVRKEGQPALPGMDDQLRHGNALVCSREWREAGGSMTTRIRESVVPFTWGDEFPEEMAGGGFSAIVGNPPYIRIQKMAEYSPAELGYYRSPQSPFAVAGAGNFDKYYLFLERTLTLVQGQGRIGVIVPNKFFVAQGAEGLRGLMTAHPILEEIVDFGSQQVFASAKNYTCILILDRTGCDEVRYEEVEDLAAWRRGE